MPRIIIPIALVASAAGIALLLTRLLGAGPAAGQIAAAAIGLAAGWGWARQLGPEPRRDPAPDPEPAAGDLGPGLEAALLVLDEPTLLVRHGEVVRANDAARALLGAHVEGEDVRLVIRHPQASAALASDSEGSVELADLGASGSRFQLDARRLADGSRLLRLADRSLSHATDQMRTDFVANASHELRTPLATLLGFIETLEDAGAADDPATRARFLAIMAGEARRMQRLVDDLMSLSRIEIDRFTTPSAPVDLGALAAEVAATIATAQHLEPGRLVVSNSGDTTVAGDRAQLSQLLHNLIGNALKYGRAGAPVRVSVDESDGTVRLSVVDEGDGIPAEHLPRITERFYRVDPGRSRGLGGTGLGLAIVKHIAERHRARLLIESRVGQGTAVTTSFPRLS